MATEGDEQPPVQYRIEFKPSALKQLKELDRTDQERIAKKIEALATTPVGPTRTPLRGVSAHRVRVGDFRILYEVDHGVLLVLIIRIGHRREVYRGL